MKRLSVVSVLVAALVAAAPSFAKKPRPHHTARPLVVVPASAGLCGGYYKYTC